MRLITHLLVNTVSLVVVAYILPGFVFTDFTSAFVTAVVLGVVNTFIRPVLHIIALPISILTLGIFAFFINVALLWLVSAVVPGFHINNFVTAAIASILLSIVSTFLHHLAHED